ncbi:glycosyltransferase family 4 protein [Methanosarcina mazei]|nr:glycosyltransferase family 4 protein [Methanosarcina mazei]
MDKGSPSNVARELLAKLIKHVDSLPFNEIMLFSKPKDVDAIKEKFQNMRVISYKELNEISGEYLVHFPILPTVLPNSKFLLYLYSTLIKRNKIIIQYHGDVRTELKSSYKDIRSLIHIFSYIFLPKLLKSADVVITHSYYMKGIIKRYGVPKIVVIPNAIDNYWFQQNNEARDLSTHIDKNIFNIFFHGRLSWEKGVDILLEAVGYYVKQNPKIKVYLAGEGPQKKYLKELCSKMDIDKNVIFLGNVSKEEIMFFLKNVNVAIYPSRFDNFPLAVLEALACANCPVYFSKNIGIYDFAIQDGFKLNFFEPEVTNVIKVLGSASCNNNTGGQQIQFAKNYTWNQIALKYIELYYDVINE